jgi:hypothetical protein
MKSTLKRTLSSRLEPTSRISAGFQPGATTDQYLVVGKLQVMVSESKAELWDSITYFATTTQYLKESQ